MERLQCGLVYTDCLLTAGSDRLWGSPEFHRELTCGPRRIRAETTAPVMTQTSGQEACAGRTRVTGHLQLFRLHLEAQGSGEAGCWFRPGRGFPLAPPPSPGHSSDLQQPDADSQSWTYGQGFLPSKLCSALPVFTRNEKTTDPYLLLKRS